MTIQRNLFARREICRISGPPPRRRRETRERRVGPGRTTASGSFLPSEHRGRGPKDGAGAELVELLAQLGGSPLGRRESLPQLAIVLENVAPKAGLGVLVIFSRDAVLAPARAQVGRHDGETRDEHRPERWRETRDEPLHPPHSLSPFSRSVRVADKCCRRPSP